MQTEWNHLGKWLEAWGYTDSPTSLHTDVDAVPANHSYGSELRALLNPLGLIRAHAVFDVEGVPTVCFVERDASPLDDDELLRALRESIWNQNLISIVLTVTGDFAVAAPTSIPNPQFAEILFSQARQYGAFSREDIQSGDVFERHPSWFAPENRVDRKLLSNLELVVASLDGQGVDKAGAQLLMAQVLFAAYLEHRGIAGDDYRASRKVGSLFELMQSSDRRGIAKLMKSLKADFNGDLLAPDGAVGVWTGLSNLAIQVLTDFLANVDLASGQRSFWHYDFRFIPVELISGIYESFLADERRDVGAYYTPRHLATLAVDQALAGSQDLLAERIYDGACGSGILLTTAYRRILAHAEARSKSQWTFSKRVELLQSTIFGSDINESACKVTAFSLYLSVLENLQPADLTLLADSGNAKLPELSGSNIFHGSIKGDFFSSNNKLAKRTDFTLFLSNPPWVEPRREDRLSSDLWAEKYGYALPRRQTCAAFMLRALSVLDPQRGRFCLIAPVSVLGAPTSQEFVRTWIAVCEPVTIINFGDLRKLLFENALQPTLVILGRPRQVWTGASGEQRATRDTQTFQYWVPKADVSLAFGRLTLHTIDRHTIQTEALWRDNSVLTKLFWGTPQDLAIISRLQLRGQLGDLLARPGWRTAKGFHKRDSSVTTLSPINGLARHPYLDARYFPEGFPLVEETILRSFPAGLKEVPNLGPDLLALFKGPRIVFKDGMTPERRICAAYSSRAFSFSSSVGVIAGPSEDAELLRFLAVYLTSDLVRYLMLLTAYQVSFERERVSLTDIKRLPFVHPDDHQNPDSAKHIIREVSSFLTRLEEMHPFSRAIEFEEWRPTAEQLIGQYLGLSSENAKRIEEVVQVVLPSIQPSSYAALSTPLQARASKADMESYTDGLRRELTAWRDATNGQGHFNLQVSSLPETSRGSLAVIRLDVSAEMRTDDGSDPQGASDVAVMAMIKKLQATQSLPVPLQENLYLASDLVVRQGHSLYLIKPMVRRLWLQSEAFRDAERIVQFVQGSTSE